MSSMLSGLGESGRSHLLKLTASPTKSGRSLMTVNGHELPRVKLDDQKDLGILDHFFKGVTGITTQYKNSNYT